MEISIITLFPQMFEGPFKLSIIKRAIDKKIASINIIDLRNFGTGKHKTVDDKPYGGGLGMILKVDVLDKAIQDVKKLNNKAEKIILLSARGKRYNQTKAWQFSKLKHLILICGHYEGVDERVLELVDEEVSIGDFVLTGGEIAAMVIADSVIRLIPGAIREGATITESFAANSGSLLEYPHYTGPRTYKGKGVPEVLLSGNHKRIEEWKKEKSLEITKAKRPDLIIGRGKD